MKERRGPLLGTLVGVGLVVVAVLQFIYPNGILGVILSYSGNAGY